MTETDAHTHSHEPAPQTDVLSTDDLQAQIVAKIEEHPVLLFMKGTPDHPYCGFSARTVAALDGIGASYAAVDVLPDPRIRDIVSAHSEWPTIPQLFVDGTLVGGCDIVTEMAETGELKELIQTVGR